MNPIYFIDEQKRIIKLAEGVFTHAGVKCCPGTLTCIGDTVTADKLGYRVGQLFRAARTTAFYIVGSVWQLVGETEALTAEFRYVSGEKAYFHAETRFICTENLVPLDEEESSKLLNGLRAEAKLRAAIEAVRPEALVNLPENIFTLTSSDKVTGDEKPATLLQRAFHWSETGQGYQYWCKLQAKLEKAAADRERVFELLKAAGREDAVENLPEFIADFTNLADWSGSFKWGDNAIFWRAVSGNVQNYLQKLCKIRQKVVDALQEAGMTCDLPEFYMDYKDVNVMSDSEASEILGKAFDWDIGGGVTYWRLVRESLASFEKRKRESASSKKVTMTGKYKTRDGRDIRILCIDRPDDRYTVVGLTDKGDVLTLTEDGKFVDCRDSNEDLVEVENTFHKDQKVEVSDDGVEWQKRHYSHYQDGYHRTFNGGGRSNDTSKTSPWKFCRSAKP